MLISVRFLNELSISCPEIPLQSPRPLKHLICSGEDAYLLQNSVNVIHPAILKLFLHLTYILHRCYLSCLNFKIRDLMRFIPVGFLVSASEACGVLAENIIHCRGTSSMVSSAFSNTLTTKVSYPMVFAH